MASKSNLSNNLFLQLLLIVSLCLVSVLIFTVIAGIILIFVYHISIGNITNYTDENTIAGLKLFQLLSSIGLFIVPPIVFSFIVHKKGFNYLKINNPSKTINYILIFVFMIISTPLLSWIVEINSNMVLPDFLHGLEAWMKQSEADATVLTNAFLTFKGVPSLIYVLFIIAIVPAIGEELLFRGIFQQMAISATKNKHIGIWIAAFFFSALHMQFYGFLPRMLLGAVFGYFYVWSKSLWLPILGHFINNGSVVLLTYFYPAMVKNTDVSLFGDNEKTILFIIFSLILSIVILWYFKKINLYSLQDSKNEKTTNNSLDNKLTS